VLRRLFGEGLEVLTTGAFAGLFANWIPKIWKGLAEGIGHPLVKDYIEKRVVNAKGLKDSHLFGYFLSISTMPPAKKRQIENVFNDIEMINPKFAENARIIIAMDEIGRGNVTVKEKNGTVTTTPDPSYKHPGVSILENLAKCKTDIEIIAAIMAMGAFNEAPNGTLDEIQIWVKKTALPNIIIFFDEAASAIGDGIFTVTKWVDRQYDERIARAFERQRLRRERWYHWVNPFLWLEWFMDLR
jgi:hypothetical protein